jgi:branched-chain amino acid transport system substrate-binding protein
MRRRLSLLAMCLAAGAALAAGQPASQAPIKVGFLGPLSGPYVQNGRDILNGFLLALDEMGHRAGGRPIELIVEDDEAIPAVGLTKARKLIERDHVQLMTGALLSSTGYALAPYIDSMKVPMIYPVVSADDLTQRRPGRWIIRTGWTASQPNHAFGEYAYRTLKRRRVATISLDYAFGWESVGGFERTFVAEGGTIAQKIWVPFMGDEALGVITALHYSAALETPANTAFASAYRSRYKKIPSYYSESMYSGAKWFAAAADAVHGNVEDSEGFLHALRSVRVSDLPRGPVRLDEYGSPIENIYIRKVERVNGALQNTVIETLPAVSQFWKFDAAEYLKQPLYARR